MDDYIGGQSDAGGGGLALFVYVPGHQGRAGKKMADTLAKEATVSGRRVEVEIPRVYTRRQCRDRSWQLWSQEWEALEDETGMDGGGAKV